MRKNSTFLSKALSVFLSASLFCSLFLATGLNSARAGSQGTADSQSSLEQQAEREIVRRQQAVDEALRLLTRGDEALQRGDFEEAYVLYLDAVEKIPDGAATSSVRQRALGKFSSGAMQYAHWLVNQGRFSEAEQVAKTVLLPQMNPGYRPAVQFLANLEQPDYFNKTVTPAFAAQRERVVELLQQAEGYYATGRYDLATKRYEEVLSIDPYNNAARRGMESVNASRTDYYGEARNETRSRMLWEVTQGWESPIRQFEQRQSAPQDTLRRESGTELIQAKLNRIIIPSIDLENTTLSEALLFLKQQSERLDPTQDGGKRGVNILLRQATVGGDGEQAEPVGDQRVNLALRNVPLFVALDYLAQLSGLRVKIEPHAVMMVPLSEPVESLVTREYRVPPGFIPPAPPEDPSAGGFGVGGGAITSGPSIGGRLDAKRFLEDQGVLFPPGATARYIPQGSKLIVVNTPENVEVIDKIVSASVDAPPEQVQIESKFLEVTQNNLSELGFDWLLGPVAIGGGVYAGGGEGRIVDPGGYPFQQGGGPVGSYEMTRGLRTGSGLGPRSGVTVNSIDALLAGAAGISGAAPAFFGVSGIFTNPQFQVLIRALSQKKGVDLMSAPTVTTKSGNSATIKVARRFWYPTEFDPPQIPQSTQQSTSGDVAQTPFSQAPPTITPSHPTGWQERDIGVTMEVTPQVGSDRYTIDLRLTPEVVDFDGFINYGSPINAVGYREVAPFTYVPEAQTLTQNVINQPIFSTRRVDTNVTIWDGQTVALGGLMREDVQKVEDKVPLLGDIPIAGRLFRSNIDQKIKRNLIVFVTARILDAEGQPIRRDDEEDDPVDLLGLPPDLPRPEFVSQPLLRK